MYSPTATHEVVVAHSTPNGSVDAEPVGAPFGTTDQVLPFQRSIKGRLLDMPPAYDNLKLDPTAVQLVGAAHETAVSELLWLGSGLGATDHRLPCQCRMSGFTYSTLLFLKPLVHPTAKQLVV